MAEQVLLDRNVIHRTRPVAKAVAAVFGWGNSLVTTTLCVIWVERVLTQQWSWISVVVGAVLFAVLTLAQIYTADAHELANVIVTTPDALMTAVPWGYLLIWFFTVLLGPLAGWLIGVPLAWYIGIASARLPERLVFGQRRWRSDLPWMLRLVFG